MTLGECWLDHALNAHGRYSHMHPAAFPGMACTGKMTRPVRPSREMKLTGAGPFLLRQPTRRPKHRKKQKEQQHQSPRSWTPAFDENVGWVSAVS